MPTRGVTVSLVREDCGEFSSVAMPPPDKAPAGSNRRAYPVLRFRLVRLARRHRTSVTQADEAVGVEETLILLAQGELATQLSDADSHDAKALGILGAELALIALGFAARPMWTLWFIPAIVLVAASVVLLVLDLWPRAYNIGPDIADLYSRAASEPSAREANQLVLAQVVAAFNDNLPAARLKSRFLSWGLRTGVVGVCLGTVIFLLVDFRVIHA